MNIRRFINVAVFTASRAGWLTLLTSRSQDLEGARFLADGLVTRSLLQRRIRDQYFVHDLLLDFAKVTINKSSSNVKDTATSRQATFLGRIEVLQTYFGGERADAGLYALTTLWLSLKKLGGDSVSAVKEYTASLEDLDRSGKKSESEVADTRCSVARLIELQVGLLRGRCLQKKYGRRGGRHHCKLDPSPWETKLCLGGLQASRSCQVYKYTVEDRGCGVFSETPAVHVSCFKSPNISAGQVLPEEIGPLIPTGSVFLSAYV